MNARRLFRRSSVAALLALSCAALAQVSQEVAEELLRKSGIWQQLGDVSAQASAGLEAALSKDTSKISDDERARVLKIFAHAYEAPRLRAAASASLQKHMDAKRLAGVRAWYDSPLGARITALEEAQSAAPTTLEQRIKQGREAYTQSATGRQELLKQIVDVTRAAEGVTQMLISTAVGIRRGILSLDPASVGPSPADLSAELEKRRDAIEQRYKGVMLAQLASAYQSLSDEDLKRYADFLAGEAGAGFTAASIGAMQDALTGSAEEIGRELERSAPKKGA